MTQKVAIVTGAGSGIGQATALAFARHGHAIVAVGRTESKLTSTARLIQDAGGQCRTYPADVADCASVRNLMAGTLERFDRVDVLINNAAQVACAGIDEMDVTAFDAMLRVNCAGMFYCTKEIWPIMKRQGGGAIINISSVASVDPFPGLAAYGATKAFVNALTKGLAAEGRPHGINVFAIGPGAVETEMLRGVAPDCPADLTLPPSAVADLAVTLTSDACRYSTGQTIYIRKS